VRVDRVRKRISEISGYLNVVLFTPHDVDIVAGPPGRRRRYLDDALCQVDVEYARALAAYGDALRQHNAVLRHLRESPGDPAQLAPFERTLAQTGALVSLRRWQTIGELSGLAGRLEQDLTAGLEWLRLEYVAGLDLGEWPPEPNQVAAEPRAEDASVTPIMDALSADFRTALASRRREAIARGVTVVGPHRDEVRFISGSPSQGTHGVDLGTFGSRGQQRTAVMALKLAEVEWMRERTGEAPVLLLDEVLAELDATRRSYLLRCVDGLEQTVLTATDPTMFASSFRSRATMWAVAAGVIVPD
jgi:DNA replication and repair protein RecF